MSWPSVRPGIDHEPSAGHPWPAGTAASIIAIETGRQCPHTPDRRAFELRANLAACMPIRGIALGDVGRRASVRAMLWLQT